MFKLPRCWKTLGSARPNSKLILWLRVRLLLNYLADYVTSKPRQQGSRVSPLVRSKLLNTSVDVYSDGFTFQLELSLAKRALNFGWMRTTTTNITSHGSNDEKLPSKRKLRLIGNPLAKGLPIIFVSRQSSVRITF
ncbi:hypothetical protein KQX54_006884 [Cotesia glomerata]|uniref:Uncharacterized protein n=1 Tax=Cotesia glomerata TaxID=32391 RepID=A0AAV7HXN1_COTGL|nr:hypothetical protein KQX54_006884 [Cotesia glomerata]